MKCFPKGIDIQMDGWIDKHFIYMKENLSED